MAYTETSLQDISTKVGEYEIHFKDILDNYLRKNYALSVLQKKLNDRVVNES
jgi:hypothetical protein